jgi:hypothetical protein
MKSLLLVILLLLSTAAAQAGPAERAVLAAMQLSEQSNYSWSSTITDDANTYEVEGRTSLADGWTWMRMPVVKSIARRLGREADTHVEALFRSSNAFVIRTHDGWRTLGELPTRHRDWRGDDDYWIVPVSSTGYAGLAGHPSLSAEDPFGTDPFATDPFDPFARHRLERDPFASSRFPRLLMVPVPKNEDLTPYSNAQFALCRPHDQLAIIVGSCVDLHVEDDAISGTLSDMGARLLLVREGQDHIDPQAAAGIFKLHIQDGVVTRFTVRLEGIVVVEKKRHHVRQTSTTTIRNIGTTTFEVPDEARSKVDS